MIVFCLLLHRATLKRASCFERAFPTGKMKDVSHSHSVKYYLVCTIGHDREFLHGLHNLSRVHFMDIGFTLPAGDPSLRGGNGIPPRCVYLEEMAADLDGQDWLDMDNIEQVRPRRRPFELSP